MKESIGVVNHIRTLNPLPQIAIFLFVLSVQGFAAAQTDSFDTPLKKKVVDFGPAPYYAAASRVRAKLSCYFFPTLMVEEYDTGQKGAEWLAIVPIVAATPACTRSHAVSEKVIEEPEWRGYFKGVKGNLVFFYASDGTNGGMSFVVYDSRTGTKIFQDSAFDSTWLHNKVEVSLFNRPRVSSTPDGQVSIRYLRVVEADCDLYREKVSCWEQVRKKFEVKGTAMPVCNSYRDVTTRWASALAYPVEVSLFPEPTTKTIDGPVKCWPVD
jgi:hypothetical protein